ncbi:MAG: DUF5103 domain-containing protein, partial [Flavobacteriales bacterium]
MQRILHLLLFSFFFFHFSSFAQDDDYFDETFLRYEDRTYQESIKSVQLNITNVPLSLPVISLTGGQQLTLRFDDLVSEYQDYTYTVIHCDRNWEETDIPQPEYIDGFLEETILNYDFSFNTVQPFIHYSFSIPNNNFRLKLSGNYILMVYKDFDREKPIITRRFRVYEDLVDVTAQVRIPMIINKRATHHQVDVVVEHPQFDIRNPIGDMSIHIQQNYRWDNIKTDLKPIFIKSDRVIYDNMGEVLFEGGNEFRWVDSRSLRYQTENTANIWFDEDSMKNHIFLTTDKPFSKDHYQRVPDVNGAFSIDIREGSDPNRDADYTYVHFSIKYPEPILDGGLYIYGGLTEWQVKPEHRLEYNPGKRMYEGTMYLKQGYYNYQYIYLRDGETEGETELTEGSFRDARQIYTFYVYHQQMG